MHGLMHALCEGMWHDGCTCIQATAGGDNSESQMCCGRVDNVCSVFLGYKNVAFRFMVLWDARQSFSETGLNDTPCQIGKFISSTERPSIELPWAPPGNGLDLSLSGEGCCSLQRSACILHVPHAQHTLTTCMKTCVTFRHFDSGDQRQWCIVGSCVQTEKTRQGDSALIDIGTFVRHLSAYFWSERWVSSNPYFEEENGSLLMEDVSDVKESWQLTVSGVFL